MNNFRFVLRTLNIIFKYLYVLRYFSIEYSIYKIAYFRNFQRVFTNLHNFLVMNSSNQRFKHARKFMHMQEIHSFFAYELKIYNSWNKAVVSKYFLVVFALSFISSFRVEHNYLVINYSLVFPLVFCFCTYKKIYTYIFRDFFNVILYSWGLKQLMIYQMNTFGFSSKGPFYFLLLCFFFFFASSFAFLEFERTDG